MLAASPAFAVECVLSDGRYVYDLGDEKTAITIMGKECTSVTQLAMNGMSTDTIITCKGINPIAVTYHQGELYAYDMVTGREEMIVDDCDSE